MKRRNYVQKHALQYQKAGVMKDRKKDQKKGKHKHKQNLTKHYKGNQNNDCPFSLPMIY
jgi:hypothetical protein